MNPRKDQNRLRAQVWLRVRGLLFLGPGYVPDRTKQCLITNEVLNSKIAREDDRKKRDHFTKWVEKCHETFDDDIKAKDSFQPPWYDPEDVVTTWYKQLIIGGQTYMCKGLPGYGGYKDGVVPHGDYVEVQLEKSHKGIGGGAEASGRRYGLLRCVYKQPSPQDENMPIIYVGLDVLGANGSSNDVSGNGKIRDPKFQRPSDLAWIRSYVKF